MFFGVFLGFEFWGEAHYSSVFRVNWLFLEIASWIGGIKLFVSVEFLLFCLFFLF